MQRLTAVYDRYNRGEQRLAKPNDITECKSNSADKLRELATVWHREAQTTRNLETYALAQYIYKEYREIPDGEGRLRHELVLRRASLQAR
jgi:hypothetical protein